MRLPIVDCRAHTLLPFSLKGDCRCASTPGLCGAFLCSGQGITLCTMPQMKLDDRLGAIECGLAALLASIDALRECAEL